MLTTRQKQPKNGSTLKFIQITSAVFMAFAVSACSHSHDAPAQPCQVGVDGAGCGLTVVQHSSWSTHVETAQTDPNTKQPIPGSERKIKVTYEFTPHQPLPLWRRTIVVETTSGSNAMFQQGEVERIDGGTVSFSTKESTCDDQMFHFANGNFTLYYQRSGNGLNFDTQPFAPSAPSSSLEDAFGNAIAQGLAQGLRLGIESVFTLGSARTFLTSGHGSFQLEPTTASMAQQLSAKHVDVGCFSSFGSGFSKSNVVADW